MIPRIKSAQYIREYIIHITFDDGIKGDIDLYPELDGDIFKPLKDVNYFKAFKLDPELHTLVWPNGADFAPEFLYDKIRVLTKA